jgi:hypothetical protein
MVHRTPTHYFQPVAMNDDSMDLLSGSVKLGVRSAPPRRLRRTRDKINTEARK